MNTIEQTAIFAAWFGKLRDSVARKQIAKRIAFAEADHLPDVKPVGDRVSEMRIHVGPGYRVYFTRKDGAVIVLLAGGDKSTQARDIAAARALAVLVHGVKP